MGQKVNPTGIRLKINKNWKSQWYVDSRDYAKVLHEDLQLRKFLMRLPEVKNADIADIEIIRQPQRATVTIHTSRPGVIIGAKGATIEKITMKLQGLTKSKIQVKIKEIKKPEINAQLIAIDMSRKLSGRASFRRSLKMAVSQAMKNGALGIKILISGRLGGAEMSRSEVIKQGQVPLHTFRANIDYGFNEAQTTFGIIGVKVWVFTGETLKRETKEDAGTAPKLNRNKV